MSVRTALNKSLASMLCAVHILLFVVIGGSSSHAGNRAAGEHGGKLLRGQPQRAHRLDDLQVFRLGFLRLQGFQLVLVLRDLLAYFGNLLVNALDFVLSHFNHSFSQKSALPVHQAVALDALVGQRIASDFAGVTGIALHGVNPAAVRADNDANMVGFSVGVPVEEDGVAGGNIGIIRPTPLPVRLEPRDALGLAGRKARFGQPHLAVAPGDKTGAPLHAGGEAVPAPVGLTAYVAYLAFGDVHHRLIAGPGSVHKLHTGQTLGIAGVGRPTTKNQRFVAQRAAVHLIHFHLFRSQQLRSHREL